MKKKSLEKCVARRFLVGAPGRPCFRKRTIPLVVALIWAGTSPSVWSLPVGEDVVQGQVVVTRPTATHVRVEQGSEQSIVNWQSFNLGAGERAQFVQPSSSSVILNRVLGASASEIAGRVEANGHVILVNPNGVYFTKTAVVDVNGMIAGTLNISNQDFLSKRWIFSQSSPGGVVRNDGSIVAGAGGFIALLGNEVINNGSITVPNGTVGLAAGERVKVDFDRDGLLSFDVSVPAALAKISHSGVINVDGGRAVLEARVKDALQSTVINSEGVVRARGIVSRNGQIFLGGGDSGIVSVSGSLDVRGNEERTHGGEVRVLGAEVILENNARIDASGNGGGGTVLVGGDYRGAGVVTRNAARVTVEGEATLEANALSVGHGGKVVIWADERTTFRGSISAVGGNRSGDGGFAEVSGKKELVFQGAVDLRAPQGRTGELLLDPGSITIVAGSAELPNNIGADKLAELLSTQNITLDTGDNEDSNNGGVQTITVSAPVSWTSDKKLSLIAGNSILLNASISNTSANPTASLSLSAGTGAISGVGTLNVRNIDLSAGSIGVAAPGNAVSTAGTVRLTATATSGGAFITHTGGVVTLAAGSAVGTFSLTTTDTPGVDDSIALAGNVTANVISMTSFNSITRSAGSLIGSGAAPSIALSGASIGVDGAGISTRGALTLRATGTTGGVFVTHTGGVVALAAGSAASTFSLTTTDTAAVDDSIALAGNVTANVISMNSANNITRSAGSLISSGAAPTITLSGASIGADGAAISTRGALALRVGGTTGGVFMTHTGGVVTLASGSAASTFSLNTTDTAAADDSIALTGNVTANVIALNSVGNISRSAGDLIGNGAAPSITLSGATIGADGAAISTRGALTLRAAGTTGGVFITHTGGVVALAAGSAGSTFSLTTSDTVATDDSIALTGDVTANAIALNSVGSITRSAGDLIGSGAAPSLTLGGTSIGAGTPGSAISTVGALTLKGTTTAGGLFVSHAGGQITLLESNVDNEYDLRAGGGDIVIDQNVQARKIVLDALTGSIRRSGSLDGPANAPTLQGSDPSLIADEIALRSAGHIGTAATVGGQTNPAGRITGVSSILTKSRTADGESTLTAKTRADASSSNDGYVFIQHRQGNVRLGSHDWNDFDSHKGSQIASVLPFFLRSAGSIRQAPDSGIRAAQVSLRATEGIGEWSNDTPPRPVLITNNGQSGLESGAIGTALYVQGKDVFVFHTGNVTLNELPTRANNTLAGSWNANPDPNPNLGDPNPNQAGVRGSGGYFLVSSTGDLTVASDVEGRHIRLIGTDLVINSNASLRLERTDEHSLYLAKSGTGRNWVNVPRVTNRNQNPTSMVVDRLGLVAQGGTVGAIDTPLNVDVEDGASSVLTLTASGQSVNVRSARPVELKAFTVDDKVPMLTQNAATAGAGRYILSAKSIEMATSAREELDSIVTNNLTLRATNGSIGSVDSLNHVSPVSFESLVGTGSTVLTAQASQGDVVLRQRSGSVSLSSTTINTSPNTVEEVLNKVDESKLYYLSSSGSVLGATSSGRADVSTDRLVVSATDRVGGGAATPLRFSSISTSTNATELSIRGASVFLKQTAGGAQFKDFIDTSAGSTSVPIRNEATASSSGVFLVDSRNARDVESVASTPPGRHALAGSIVTKDGAMIRADQLVLRAAEGAGIGNVDEGNGTVTLTGADPLNFGSRVDNGVTKVSATGDFVVLKQLAGLTEIANDSASQIGNVARGGGTYFLETSLSTGAGDIRSGGGVIEAGVVGLYAKGDIGGRTRDSNGVVTVAPVLTGSVDGASSTTIGAYGNNVYLEHRVGSIVLNRVEATDTQGNVFPANNDARAVALGQDGNALASNDEGYFYVRAIDREGTTSGRITISQNIVGQNFRFMGREVDISPGSVLRPAARVTATRPIINSLYIEKDTGNFESATNLGLDFNSTTLLRLGLKAGAGTIGTPNAPLVIGGADSSKPLTLTASASSVNVSTNRPIVISDFANRDGLPSIAVTVNEATSSDGVFKLDNRLAGIAGDITRTTSSTEAGNREDINLITAPIMILIAGGDIGKESLGVVDPLSFQSRSGQSTTRLTADAQNVFLQQRSGSTLIQDAGAGPQNAARSLVGSYFLDVTSGGGAIRRASGSDDGANLIVAPRIILAAGGDIGARDGSRIEPVSYQSPGGVGSVTLTAVGQNSYLRQLAGSTAISDFSYRYAWNDATTTVRNAALSARSGVYFLDSAGPNALSRIVRVHSDDDGANTIQASILVLQAGYSIGEVTNANSVVAPVHFLAQGGAAGKSILTASAGRVVMRQIQGSTEIADYRYHYNGVAGNDSIARNVATDPGDGVFFLDVAGATGPGEIVRQSAGPNASVGDNANSIASARIVLTAKSGIGTRAADGTIDAVRILSLEEDSGTVGVMVGKTVLTAGSQGNVLVEQWKGSTVVADSPLGYEASGGAIRTNRSGTGTDHLFYLSTKDTSGLGNILRRESSDSADRVDGVTSQHLVLAAKGRIGAIGGDGGFRSLTHEGIDQATIVSASAPDGVRIHHLGSVRLETLRDAGSVTVSNLAGVRAEGAALSAYELRAKQGDIVVADDVEASSKIQLVASRAITGGTARAPTVVVSAGTFVGSRDLATLFEDKQFVLVDGSTASSKKVLVPLEAKRLSDVAQSTTTLPRPFRFEANSVGGYAGDGSVYLRDESLTATGDLRIAGSALGGGSADWVVLAGTRPIVVEAQSNPLGPDIWRSTNTESRIGVSANSIALYSNEVKANGAPLQPRKRGDNAAALSFVVVSDDISGEFPRRDPTTDARIAVDFGGVTAGGAEQPVTVYANPGSSQNPRVSLRWKDGPDTPGITLYALTDGRQVCLAGQPKCVAGLGDIDALLASISGELGRQVKLASSPTENASQTIEKGLIGKAGPGRPAFSDSQGLASPASCELAAFEAGSIVCR